MTAYMIFIRERTNDRDALRAYRKVANATMEGHDIGAAVAYGPLEALEGPEPEGIAVLTFDSMAAAHDWYDSAAYREAREHRFKGAEFRVLLVEGV